MMVGLHRWQVLSWKVPVSLLVEKGKPGHPAQEGNVSPWRGSFQEEQPCSEILGHTPCLGAERKTAVSEH